MRSLTRTASAYRGLGCLRQEGRAEITWPSRQGMLPHRDRRVSPPYGNPRRAPQGSRREHKKARADERRCITSFVRTWHGQLFGPYDRKRDRRHLPVPVCKEALLLRRPCTLRILIGEKDPVRQYHQARIKMAAMDTDRTVASLYTQFTKNEGLICRDRLQAREEHGARSCDAGDAEDHLRHADEKKGMHKGIDRPSPWGHALPCLKRQSP